MEHDERHHGLILNPWVDSFSDPEQEAVDPKDYRPKGRVDENLWSYKQLLFDRCNSFCWETFWLRLDKKREHLTVKCTLR